MIFKIKLVILDYDLTLINNLVDFYISFSESLEKFSGSKISFNEFYEYMSSDKLVSIPPKSIDSRVFWKDMRKRICRSHAIIPSIGVKEFLNITSSSNVKNVIVSGKECYSKYLEMELEKIGIREYINGIYTFFDLDILNGVEESLFDKSWLLKHVLNEYSIEPSDAVYIGDYKLDYYSSLKVGINFIGFATIPGRIKMFKDLGVKYIARNFYEVLHLLVKIKR